MKIARSGFFTGVSAQLSTISIILIALTAIIGATVLQEGGALQAYLRQNVISSLNVYFLPLVSFFVLFVVVLMVTPWGSIRLGDDDEKPEFGGFAWFAMLFSCGMGIGLIFWGVAEPIYHYQGNPLLADGQAMTEEAKQVAMRITFLHWGLHPWATYAIVGLTLAYFAYRKKMPLTFRSALYPIFGDKVKGVLGDVVDIIAVFITVVGVATSLGLGSQQINAGLHHLLGVPISATVQVILVAGITAIATISAVTGLARGIKYLSVANIWLSIGILVLIFLLFMPGSLVAYYAQNVIDYMNNLFALSVWIDDTGWQDGWTTFYWAWWITWAPFVGMFIARISRGRTIRQFLFGVLVLPTLIGFIWLTIFGNTALDLQSAVGGIIEAVNQDVALAIYAMFDSMDIGAFSAILSFMVMALIFTYFVTSADSGTLVVTTILAGGNLNPPTKQRVLWGTSEGVVAAALLIGGGLSVVQTAAILVSLPFSIIMILMMIGLVKALMSEKRS